MVTVGWDTSNLKLLYNDSNNKVCIGCCSDYPDYELPYRCCYCPSSSKTPKYYTVHISGVTKCEGQDRDGAAVNGLWKLTIDENRCDCCIGDYSCRWFYDDGVVRIYVDWSNTTGNPIFGVIGGVYEGIFLYPGYRHSVGGAVCADETCGDEVANDIQLPCVGAEAGYGGIATWEPYWYAQWITSVAYPEGWLVYNDGDFYICISPHEAAAINEPGTGASWESYWDVATSYCA